MGEIYELFVLALSLVWFAGATPDYFGGNSCAPIIGPYLFLRKFVWTNDPESSSKVSPYTGIGPWMAIPSKGPFCKKNTTALESVVFCDGRRF